MKEFLTFQDKTCEITQSDQNKENIIKKNEESLYEIWDTIKYPIICGIGIPEEMEKGIENLLH